LGTLDKIGAILESQNDAAARNKKSREANFTA
jgi:hypothetical protein